jgi:site-specific recombinase XerD
MRRIVGLLVLVVVTMLLGTGSVGAQQGYTDVAWERLIVPVPSDGT